MKNNEKTKKLISKIGIDGVLQCIIESIDDSIALDESVPLWKINILEYLEQAYEVYMTKDENYANIRN